VDVEGSGPGLVRESGDGGIPAAVASAGRDAQDNDTRERAEERKGKEWGDEHAQFRANSYQVITNQTFL
jgi:hypothetical protein